MTHDGRSTRLYPILAVAGLAAGLSIWALAEVLPDRLEDDRQLLLISAAAGAFWLCVLATAGPLRIGQAILAALLIALPSAALLWGASFRFDTAGAFLDSGHPVAAFAALVGIGLPFAMAVFRFDQDPTNYTALFENAWGLVTRIFAALAFIALFWGAITLGDVLLQLVELPWIEEAIAVAWVPYVLSGLCAGLALALAHRLSAVIGPDILIGLLRMLLPLVAVITAVFLVALAARGTGGLDQLFGDFSAAATLMAMGAFATLLIAAAVERGGLWAVQGRVMTVLTGALALMLPVLGALAATAIRMRVEQYGWTPDRLAAATGAVLLCGYGATHAVAVLSRRNWMQRIRQGNVLMAACILLAAALWLNPLRGPQEIAAQSVAARLTADPASVTDRDLELLAGNYGRAGQAALAGIEATAGEDLRARLDAARAQAGNVSDGSRPTQASVIEDLAGRLAVRPAGAAFPRVPLEGLSLDQLLALRAGCGRSAPGGAPGCAALLADLDPEAPGDEMLVLYLVGPDHLAVFGQSADGQTRLRLEPFGTDWPSDAAALEAVLSGGATLAPLPRQGLSFGNHVLFALP